MLTRFFVLLLVARANLVSAAANLTSTGCADASGLQSCLNKAASTSSQCLDEAKKNNSELEALACGCSFYTDNINCYASHCWNRVNECEYQEYAISYLKNCNIASLPIPYFPAPDDAEDACSCNLGKVYVAFSDSVKNGDACQAAKPDLSDPIGAENKLGGCKCCEISGGLSSIYDICPDTDPSLVGLSYVSQLEELLQSPFTACGSYLSEYDCTSDLSFSSSLAFYNPNNLPSSGTATLSNGAGTVTTPASGSVFSYTNVADKQVYTISAAGSVGKGGGGSDAKETAKETGGSTGGSTGTSSADDPEETDAGPRTSSNWALAVLASLLVVMATSS